MVYAISDLHGYPLEKFRALLDSVGFSEADTLYVIGDVIDRNGDGGVELLRYIMAQPNFEFILGNHEDMLLACDFLFGEITEESINELDTVKTKALERYLRNGGGVTLTTLHKLEHEEPDAFRDILQFLRDAPLVGAVSAGGRDFLLVHGPKRSSATISRSTLYGSGRSSIRSISTISSPFSGIRRRSITAASTRDA